MGGIINDPENIGNGLSEYFIKALYVKLNFCCFDLNDRMQKGVTHVKRNYLVTEYSASIVYQDCLTIVLVERC